MKTAIYETDDLITKDIHSYLKTHYKKSLLRFITCGSVDDGKSTLIGRLLYDSKMIFEDQLNELSADSKKLGTQGTKLDFALLVDGLAAEREQGITIDVAYRFFTTNTRKFIVLDTPGHEQFTRNMVTGASVADLAIILIDAQKGVLDQTRRHSYICNLLGIKNFILAINKMDLIHYNKKQYEMIVEEYKNFSKLIGIKKFTAIPTSALKGDNITDISENTHWFSGPPLIECLEKVLINKKNYLSKDFCMPVQWVNRPNLNFRGFSGRVVSGSVKPGDEVVILPSSKKTHVKEILGFKKSFKKSISGDSITITLKDEVDCSRGQVIASPNSQLNMADQFEVTIIWMSENSLVPGREYYCKIGAQTISARVSSPKYLINVNTIEKLSSNTLGLNNIGVSIITFECAIPFMPYKINRLLGSFIIIDKITNETLGAGLINFALQRANNIKWQVTDISPEHHAKMKNQKPIAIWMTGLSGSGKSTIANALEIKLAKLNYHTFLLDGDNIRHGLNKDLGFTEYDRIENIRRIGEVTKLMVEAGLIVITAFISPFRAERKMVRKMFKKEQFVEVYIKTPIEIAESRDIKGLYAKARKGIIKNFTGIDSPYEEPINSEIEIDTSQLNVNEAVDKIVEQLNFKTT